MEVTIGGERLGSGKKSKAYLHNYERSTHDLSYTWRSTMAPGTLVPFLNEVALPGDTMDIDLNVDVLTHPTIGPLFGSYKIQLDVFQIPIRLYIAQLHMNMLDIGRDMSKIMLPQIYMEADAPRVTDNLDTIQTNPSSIFAYLGIRGLGSSLAFPQVNIARQFNAIPYLAYWDIYKNYYANKQEEIGAVIHKDVILTQQTIDTCAIPFAIPAVGDIPVDPLPAADPYILGRLIEGSYVTLAMTAVDNSFDASQLLFKVEVFNPTPGVPGEPTPGTVRMEVQGKDLFSDWTTYKEALTVVGQTPTPLGKSVIAWGGVRYVNAVLAINTDQEPDIYTFPLKNIDDMRLSILQFNTAGEFNIFNTSPAPYGTPLQMDNSSPRIYSRQFPMEGLALKTYQSDLFNNWISTDWIDGTDGISEITKVYTDTEGAFTIDELNLSKKVYDMLNRIAISGGTYDDWLDAVYTHERTRSAENPIYIGGLQAKLVFQEVISTAATTDNPLGTLAGRGVTRGEDRKGGHVVAKIDEPSYILGIVSLTPHVDYSQGNAWHMNLKTVNDLHKPALDAIGFQELVSDQMAYFDTRVDMANNRQILFRTVGKQPAWVNYMTNVNKTYGNFADRGQQMWMTLNRRYGAWYDPAAGFFIKDATTYIDPSKFNHIFADTRRDGQNFWCQIAVRNTARRKMSAKVMPNL